ncbi:MAG TPA: hypothetical protein VJY39_15965 [Acidisphaera sp.]|nr:hypothetical protein [Acidisphaera sp.]
MTALRFVLLLALALGAAACAPRDAAPAADAPPPEPHGQPPGLNFRLNGNTQFFGGSTWYH